MTSLADRTIEADRRTYERTAALVRGLSDDDLVRPSGASAWTVAQVVSHLGSGAEIHADNLHAALAGNQRPADANQTVWARWDAMSPREQADGFLESGPALVAAYAGLDGAERDILRIDMGFLPEPASLELFTGMRLNEALLHAWDIEVAFDERPPSPRTTPLSWSSSCAGHSGSCSASSRSRTCWTVVRRTCWCGPPLRSRCSGSGCVTAWNWVTRRPHRTVSCPCRSRRCRACSPGA